MTDKKKKLTPEYLMKCEAAKELGLWDKIEQHGWGALTSSESGRLGGILARRKRKEKKE
jgi:hypothetical protein